MKTLPAELFGATQTSARRTTRLTLEGLEGREVPAGIVLSGASSK